MRFSTVSALLSAAAAAQAGVVLRRDGNYTWDVTQYQAGLSHGNPITPTTSFYDFTVSSPAVGSPDSESYIPPFGAHCTGTGAGFPLSSDYSACVIDTTISEAGSSVAARVVPSEGSQAHIAISYVFQTCPDATRNFTAIAVTDWARELAPYNFTLVPSESL